MPTIIVVEENIDAAGKYYQPRSEELCFDGKFYSCEKGIITLSALYPDFHESTLAHEWRHHWQRFNFLEKNKNFPYWPWSSPDNFTDYKKAIAQYFTASHEFDALAFELKFARNDVSEWWMSLVVESKKSLD